MSRPLRIEYSDAWYHVMNRGRRGEKVFSDPKDYHLFIELLQESARMWNVRVAAFCLLETHYHLLVQTPEANLSRYMRHMDGVYTQRFNKVHSYDGPLFRGRYKSILVDADAYLLQVVKYIHRNPLRVGCVKDLEAYKWSSHIGYLSHGQKWSWLHKEFVLSMVCREQRGQRVAYERFVSEEDEDIYRIYDSSKWPVILGSERFIQWVKEKFFPRIYHPEIPDSRVLAPDVETIKEVVCKEYGIHMGALLKAQRGRFNEPRSVAIYLMRELRHATLDEICVTFGMGKYSSASSAVIRLKAQMAQDRRLRERIEGIVNKLNKSQE